MLPLDPERQLPALNTSPSRRASKPAPCCEAGSGSDRRGALPTGGALSLIVAALRFRRPVYDCGMEQRQSRRYGDRGRTPAALLVVLNWREGRSRRSPARLISLWARPAPATAEQDAVGFTGR